MKIRKKIVRLLCSIFFLTVVVGMSLHRVYAAELTVRFGSESYTAEVGEEFNVGVYIESDESIGAYELTLEFDLCLEYVSGADEADGQTILLKGDTQEQSEKRMLRFRLIEDKSSYLKVTAGQITPANETEAIALQEIVLTPVLAVNGDQELELSKLETSPAVLEGFDPEEHIYQLNLEHSDELAVIDAQAEDGIEITLPDVTHLQEGEQILSIDLKNSGRRVGRYYLLVKVGEDKAALPAFSYNDAEWQMLDSEAYAPAYINMPYDMAVFSIGGSEMRFICNEDREIFLFFAQSQDDTVSLFAYNPEEHAYFECQYMTTEHNNYYQMPLEALLVMPEGYSRTLLSQQGVFAAMDSNGQVGLYQNVDGVLKEFCTDSEQESTEEETDTSKGSVVLWVIMVLCVIGLAALLVFYFRTRERMLLGGAGLLAIITMILLIVQLVSGKNGSGDGSGAYQDEMITGTESILLTPVNAETEASEETETTVEEEPEEQEDEGIRVEGEVIQEDDEDDNADPAVDQNADSQQDADQTNNNDQNNQNQNTNNNQNSNHNNNQNNNQNNSQNSNQNTDNNTNQQPSETPEGGNSETPSTPTTPEEGSSETPSTPTTPEGGNSEPPSTPTTPEGGNSETPSTPTTPEGGDSEPPSTPTTPEGGSSETPSEGGGEDASTQSSEAAGE